MKKIKDRFTVILWDVYHKSERLNSASTSTQNGSKCSLFSRLEASILFTNELYSYTKDEQLLNSIHEKTQLLNSQFAGIRTNNYSLFSGKLGAGYVNMEVFITTGDRQYLLHAIKYATEYCESDAYRYDIIIKSGLGDGLAGILFFFHKLFLCSREEWIGQKAEEMIYKIVNNAYSGTAGFFWGGVTNEKGKNCGYIQGTSGVALTLYKIARVHKIPVLQAFSEEAFLYEKNNIIAAKQKEENDLLMTDISLGTGTIGTLLADLLIGEHGFLQKPSSLERVAGYLNIITEKMREERQFNLLTGIAGIGVLFTEAYKLSYGEIYLKYAVSIAETLTAAIGTSADQSLVCPDDLFGAGIFLLSILQADNKNYCPFFIPQVREDSLLSFEFITQRPLINTTYLTDIILAKNFSKTIPVLKENLLNQFGVQGESLSLWLKPENFIAFAEKTADGIEDPEKKKILRQALDRDVFVLRTLWKIEQEKAYYQVPLKEISQLMRSDPNDFSQMKFKQSNKVIVHSPEQTAINPADGDFGVFMSSYGMNAIYCRVVGDDELQVAGLGITKLIYDSYAQPASVNQVTENIIAYIFSNGEEVINWLKNNYRAPDNVTLKNILAVWVMDATQVCIMDGLLMPES